MWTYREVIETWLDLGVLEEWPSNKLPGFVDRLLAVLPQVAAHRCGVGTDYGFLKRLREGTSDKAAPARREFVRPCPAADCRGQGTDRKIHGTG